MGAFNRNRIPGWESYADAHGLSLMGRGKWRTTLCEIHADSTPSMRVNVATGGWMCMSCLAKGGDTLSHYMQRTGSTFVDAARALGAWDDAQPWGAAVRPTQLAARDALELAADDLRLLTLVLGAARDGVLPSDEDWQAFLQRAGRVEWLAAEYRV